MSGQPGADAQPLDTDGGRPVPSAGRILPWMLSPLLRAEGQQRGRVWLKGLLLRAVLKLGTGKTGACKERLASQKGLGRAKRATVACGGGKRGLLAAPGGRGAGLVLPSGRPASSRGSWDDTESPDGTPKAAVLSLMVPGTPHSPGLVHGCTAKDEKSPVRKAELLRHVIVKQSVTFSHLIVPKPGGKPVSQIPGGALTVSLHRTSSTIQY